jgi:NADP-dependent aldehyde dehydrogenase
MINITTATKNAAIAFDTYSKLTASKRAEFLETIANNIEALGDELLNVANKETNLPLPRLTGERGRTCFQLRMFATMLRKGDYVDATIDTAVPDKTPPKPDVRQMLYPLGPVVVFGASNFPFAYSTAGGDTASALAAGCPVIVKAHPAHLQTSTLVADAIQQAIKSNELPEHIFQHITATDFSAGKALVQDENIAAVGFTGSRSGGRALYDYASARKNPIPVFAEMGSVNPVVLLEGALTANAETIAKNYAGSITLGMGQFCTNPGILIGVKSDALTLFANHLANELNNVAVAPMLHEGIQSAYFKNSIHALSQTGITCLTKNTPVANAAIPVLTTVEAAIFLANPDLAEEVFGPYSILVQCENHAQLVEVWKSIQGQISTTIMGTDNDLTNNKNLLEIATTIAGRVLLNGVPTGVEVCDSMVHGGPYPASTDSRFTAVGVKAVKRWLRPISFQNWPDHLLPNYLQNKNEQAIWRTINGDFTKSDVSI